MRFGLQRRDERGVGGKWLTGLKEACVRARDVWCTYQIGQRNEPPPSARRTGTADMRWAAPRWRRGVVMRADVDVAPSSPEPPPPTHPSSPVSGHGTSICLPATASAAHYLLTLIIHANDVVRGEVSVSRRAHPAADAELIASRRVPAVPHLLFPPQQSVAAARR